MAGMTAAWKAVERADWTAGNSAEWTVDRKDVLRAAPKVVLMVAHWASMMAAAMDDLTADNLVYLTAALKAESMGDSSDLQTVGNWAP